MKPDTNRNPIAISSHLSKNLQKTDIEQSIPSRFEQMVETHADRLAVKSKSHAWTYDQLNRQANRLAHAILEKRGEGEEAIALLLENDAPLVASILGVLKTGKIYVPLDPFFPKARTQYILENSQAAILVTDHQNLPLAKELAQGKVPIINRDELDSSISEDNPGLSLSPDCLAFILYTSGSTGQPKGIVHNHRNLLHEIMNYTNGLQMDWADHVALLSSCSFVDSVRAFYGALLKGATLFPYAIKEEGFADMANWLTREKITVCRWVPTVFRHFIASLTGGEKFPAMRIMNLSGEPVIRSDVEACRKHFRKDCILVNSLGATETFTFRWLFIDQNTAITDTNVPVGYDVDDQEVFVLDEAGQPAPFNEMGEIAVKSHFLSGGYWRKPDLTKAAFSSDPAGSGAQIYRTGDLGLMRPDGCLVHMGRKDFQVKIKGYRIEASEIETALRQSPSVQQTVVVPLNDEDGEPRLVAYVVPTGEAPTTTDLRTFLEGHLPGYMIPSAFVMLEHLPRTATGKVDRLALPAPGLERPALNTPFIAPRNPTEEMVAQIWADVLGLDEVGVNDPFLELGGDSLRAAQLISRVLNVFRAELSMQTLLDAPTVADMASVLDLHPAEGVNGSNGAALPMDQSIPLRKGTGPVPLSFSQERLWFVCELEQGNPFYNISRAFRLEGHLDLDSLKLALNAVVSRHESLRTIFRNEEGAPVQVIEPPRPVDLEEVDLSEGPIPPPEQEIQLLMSQEAKRPFDLSKDLMIRAKLIRIRDEDHVLVLIFHHLVSDRWSSGILVREISEFYKAFSMKVAPSLPELPIQYADYAVWQRGWLQGETLERQFSYWKECLSDMPALLELPTDRPRPLNQSFRGTIENMTIPVEQTMALKKLSQNENVTLFMTMLAAFQTLLYRYSGAEDIVVGSPIADRTRVEAEGLIGFFVNALVLRTDLSGNPTFRELLERVRDVAVGALSHPHPPFEKVMEALKMGRNLSHSPLFQVMFALQNAPAEKLLLPEVNSRPLDIHSDTAKFDISLSMEEANGTIKGLFEYNTDLFDQSTIQRMVGHFQTLLEGILSNPDVPIAELPLMTGAEQNKVLIEWNETRMDPPSGMCVHELFEEQVARAPDSTALAWEGGELTYRDLNQRANQLAHHLKKRGVGPEVFVGVCMERSPEVVVGLLGILKAGGVYLPLDPTHPKDRIAFMLEDAGVSVLLTQKRLKDPLSELGVPTISLDADWEAMAQESTENPQGPVSPKHLAYVIYTSGSTGRPKGVLITHEAIASHCLVIREDYDIQPGDRILQFASLTFDVSVEDILPTLVVGASVILPGTNILSTQEFLRTIREFEVTGMQIPPAYWHLWAQDWAKDPDGEPLPALRNVIIGGDVVSPETLRLWRTTPGRSIRLLNSYGPTEATITAINFETPLDLPDDSLPSRIPIGRPLRNKTIYILDRYGNPVPIGIPGELYIGGEGLARGYLNRPELTAEQFIPDPFSGAPGARLYKTGDLARYLPDGNIEFLGRIDHQVKLRGFRIELGEIETVLSAYPGVRECVALIRGDTPGDKLLAAYVVANPKETPSDSDLRAFLKDKLPDYMMPSTIMILDALPLTPSGKVDRRALPSPEKGRPEMESTFVAPRTEVEKAFAEIWAEILKVERVGVHDNFFEMGGHSLLATVVVSRVRDVLDTELSLRSLFERPTIAELAQTIEQSEPKTPDQNGMKSAPMTTLIPHWDGDGPCALSFAQERLWFLDQLEGSGSTYNILRAYRVKGALKKNTLEKALQDIVARHDSLRTNFIYQNEVPVQIIEPHRTIELGEFDLRGKGEEEVQRLISQEAQRPFDLSRDLMLRAKLFQLKDLEHIILLVTHHIASDAWSMGILYQELQELYAANAEGRLPALPELPIQYADFSEWQREWLKGERLEELIAYWKGQLADSPALLDLPTDRPRPVRVTYRGAREKWAVSSEVLTALKNLSRQEDVTLFMTLLALFQTLLSRYTGSEDIVVGSPIAGRTHTETERLIGFFVNTMVLRTDLSGGPTVRELLERVREVALDAYAHQDLPFEKLVAELQPKRNLNHSPIFQVMLVLQNIHSETLTLPGLKSEVLAPDTPTSKFDLTLYLQERDEALEGILEYNTDLFDRSTIQRMLGHFEALLRSAVRAPDSPVATLPILPDVEQRQLLVEWNDTAKDTPENACVHERFEAQAARTPDAVAVEFEGEQLTYCELNQRANQLAHYLAELGVGPNALVAICVERSLEMMVGLLGVLKTGAAYVPLDPAYPEDRLTFMLEDSNVSVILTEQETAALLPKGKANLVRLDTEREKISLDRVENIEGLASSNALAYVIYTSGSTGKPKGVQIPHGALSNFLDAMTQEPGLTDRDVLLAVTTLSFDISALELFGPLVVGARVVLVSQEAAFDGYQLADTIQKSNPTVMQATPATWRVLIEVGQIPNGLKILCGGEALSRELANVLLENENSLWNMYGPTETTIWSATCQIAPGEDSISIGKPIANTTLYILDKNLEPVPVGVPGELHIGGAGLAQGYLNRPELTAEKFIPNPFSDAPGARLYKTGDLVRYLPDGNIEFLGRIDDQVKVRGFRIELGEIEAVLDEHPAIRESVVSAREDITGDKRLVGYLLPSSNKPPSISELRGFLKKKLPDYMVPSAFVTLDSLPLTPNGKVDRRALPAPEKIRPEMESAFIEPRTDLEKDLSKIWADVLGLDRIGVHDNFFDLGGHSLLATQALARIRSQMRVEIPLISIFEGPSVNEMAALISQQQGSLKDQEGVEQLLSEVEGLSEEEVKRHLSGENGSDR